MIILLTVLIVAAAAGCAAFLLMSKWPLGLSAPRVDPDAVRTEVIRHRGLRRVVNSRLEPSVLSGLALTLAVGVVVVAAAAVGILLAMVRSKTGLEGLDLNLARFGADHATATSTKVMRDISLLGGAQGLALLAVIVGVVEYRRIPNLALLLFLTVTVFGQFAVANLIKLVVDRARPDINRLTGFSGSSFPSGHAVAVASSFAAFALVMSRRRSRRATAVLVAIAATVAAGVGTTRIFLGVHWLTDVLAGLFIGWGWFALCSIAFGGRLLRFGSPAATAEAVAKASEPHPVP